MQKLKWMLVMVSLLLVGCANFKTTMTPDNNVNPDINGSPSPLEISVFELSDPAAFESANFMNLYANPAATLGSSLLAEQTLMVVPGQTATVRLPVIKTAHYLGYVAAYRNLEAVQWQLLVPVVTTGLFGQDFNLAVGNAGLVLQN